MKRRRVGDEEDPTNEGKRMRGTGKMPEKEMEEKSCRRQGSSPAKR